MADSTTPPIVLVHGLWMTPRSWESWIPYYEAKGHKVLAPAFPGFEVEVEALREDDSVIANLTLPDTIAHYESVIRELDSPPIIIGHSLGGTLVQLLLDRGHGIAGVAIDSAPPEGVRVTPLSQLKALFPVFSHPGKRHDAFGFTAEQFHKAFANTLDEETSNAAYERYHIPAPAEWLWAYGLLANLKPGKQEAWVDFHNNDRAPLLFIAGGDDQLMPPSVNQSNAKHYKTDAITDYKEFPGRCHFTCGQEGWEEIADFALSWALERAAERKAAPVQGPA